MDSLKTLLVPAVGLLVFASCASGASATKPDEAATSSGGDGTVMAENIRQKIKGNEKLTEYDVNKDGKADVWNYVVIAKGPDGKDVEKLSRKDIDFNHDGKIDIARTYDDKEQLSVENLDLDFDGKVDQVNYYEKNVIVRKERDLLANGKPSLWVFFERGKIVRRERDTNGDGKVDYWEYWEGDQVDRYGEDLDGDGNVDKWTKNPNSEG